MGLLQCGHAERLALDRLTLIAETARRYVVHSDELLSAFLELEATLL